MDRDFHVSQIGLARSRIVALILRNGYGAIRPIQEFFRNDFAIKFVAESETSGGPPCRSLALLTAMFLKMFY